MKTLILLALLSLTSFAQEDSSGSLGTACAHEGYPCGACEEGLQNDFNQYLDSLTENDLSAEHWGDLRDTLPEEGSQIQWKSPAPKYNDVLGDIMGMMRNHNDGKLNWLVIGESESLQETSVGPNGMNPRIMLKSPNSEFMVTFSTDPTLPGYNAIEIMRWNAKEARYEFQELNFPAEASAAENGAPDDRVHGTHHGSGDADVDLSGRKCANCHKSPSMRPNWDTYRAWAGIVPSRDDMLEMEFNGSEINSEQPMQPDARAYLGFLDQVAAAQSADPGARDQRAQRLAMLDIPFDQETQLAQTILDYQNRNNPPAPAPEQAEPDAQARRGGARDIAEVDPMSLSDVSKEGPDVMDVPDFMSSYFGYQEEEKSAPVDMEAVRAAAENLTPQERVEIIRRRVETDGFYRIRHHPDLTQLDTYNNDRLSFNFDQKTADAAGPSQFAFDQMQGQNMCRVANDLAKDENFDKFKYALVAAAKCYTEASDVMPESFKQYAAQYFRDRGTEAFLDSEESDLEGLEEASPDQILSMLSDDVARNHGRADDFKHDRHGRFLRNYLTTAEGVDPAVAEEQASFYAQEVVTPTRRYPVQFHAIGDEGGVTGVPEDAGDTLADLRFLLEPFGVNVNHWSMVNGRDNAYHSYSFSDQFSLFLDQKIFDDIYDDVKAELEASTDEPLPWTATCDEISARSIAALEVEVPDDQAAEDQIDGVIAQVCASRSAEAAMLPRAGSELAGPIAAINENLFAEDARQMLTTCNSCHGDNGFMTFEGLTELVETGDTQVFSETLNRLVYNPADPDNMVPFYVKFEHKLGVHGPTNPMYGGPMPPSDFPGNAAYAQEKGLDPINVQNQRRLIVANYLTAVAEYSNEGAIDWDQVCSGVTSPRRAEAPSERTREVIDSPREVIRE
ncbi:MAG: hypothetical protein CME62_15120 [Halobacteriovoraceae bacterium]|nr:hypothetical protein [Halobacteriovoraceae bacterium]